MKDIFKLRKAYMKKELKEYLEEPITKFKVDLYYLPEDELMEIKANDFKEKVEALKKELKKVKDKGYSDDEN